jgi:predicted nucleic acid-binding protein
MWLVDTSVWILVFRQREPLDLARIVDFDEIATCLPVVQEVLQGFRDERVFRVAASAMRNLPLLDEPLTFEVVETAIQLYRDARRAGVTVRSSVDCLIAASAIRNDVGVLHCDRDYTQLARVSALRQRTVPKK